MNMNKWDKPQYQRIVSATPEGDQLVVLFEDGTEVSVVAEQLLPPGTPNPLWNEIHVTPYEIVVPTSLGEREIPWTTLRLITDSEFAAHKARIAEKQAGDIGRRLSAIRRSKGLTSKEVAERAGITPQSLSRIEQGHHDVVFTTLRKILAAMGATLADLAEVNIAPASLIELLKRLESLGLKRDWIIQRLLPKQLVTNLELANAENVPELLNEAAKYISRIFNWSLEDILSSAPLNVDPSIVQAARFKTQARTDRIQATRYAAYAYYLARLALEATSHIKVHKLPSEPEIIRGAITREFGSVTFESLLRFVWAHGIPVIPLSDSGAFHGACWRIEGRGVIVLKQVTPYQARWLHDLGHETGHEVRHLSDNNASYIEPREISPFEDDDSDEEWEANEFASDLLLFGHAEELTQRCVELARGKVEYLKSAVLQTAAKEHVPVDVLANYIAHRLSMQGINWWGTANNLQITEPLPIKIARDVLFEHIDLERLSREDQELFIRAITD